MKRLLVLRHGKSKRGPEYPDDFSRPLAKRGKRDSQRMGQELMDRGWMPDVIIASPAARAVATAERVAKGAEYDGEVIYEPSLYFRGVGGAFDAIRHYAGDADTVLLVGHNPTLEEVVGWLAGQHTILATANVAYLELPIDDWARLGESTGKLITVLSPKDLD